MRLGNQELDRWDGDWGYLVAAEVIELAIETDERTLFLVEEGFESVYLHRAGGRNPLQSDTMIGKRRPQTRARRRASISRSGLTNASRSSSKPRPED